MNKRYSILLVFFAVVIFFLCSCPGMNSKKGTPPEKIRLLASAVDSNLYHNIIPFWLSYSVDTVNGGFYGTVSNDGKGLPEARKGLILNARILWTFSSLLLKDGDERFHTMAERAYLYIDEYFIDKEYGGAFYAVDKDGNPVADLKQTYANAFAIYGLAEYYRATGNPSALEQAISIFMHLEKYAYDSEYGGYLEQFQRDWSPVPEGTRNDIGDADKTMNTSLHVMEALTNLRRIWDSPLLTERLREMIIIVLEKIINQETHRQYYYFNRDWSSKADIKSYGHDIESSWLMLEAAEVLGDESLTGRVKKASLAMAESTLGALQTNGKLTYETVDGIDATSTQFWAQAEAIVGYINAWQLTGDEIWIDRAALVWNFTDNTFIDREYGEWYQGTNRNGEINKRSPKISFWKCPYHNSRMCMEVIRRAK